MGVKNLWRRKLRTFLTVLGVVIGTASIMVMVSLGLGMNEIFKQQLERMGSLTVVQVYPGWGGGMGGGDSKEKKITDATIDELSRIPNVVVASPFLQENAKMISGKYENYINIIGIKPEALEAFGYELEEGELLDNTGPVRINPSSTIKVLFGAGVKEQFWDPNSRHDWSQGPPPTPDIDLFQDRIEMSFDHSFGDRRSGGGSRPTAYRVQAAGILKASNYEVDYNVFMDLNTLKKLKKAYEKEQSRREQGNQMIQDSGSQRRKRKEEESYSRASVKVNDVNNVEEVEKTIEELGFSAYSLNQDLESMKKTSMGVQAVLGGIGAISLLVAAIGITNTMIMSIYERTREIGVMKVIGAALKDIRRIFLFEAGMIGFLGGITGLLISYGISFLMNKFVAGGLGEAMFGMGGDGASKISIIPLWLAMASLVFTTLVGLISGFYPARRAMKLSALEAIKTE